MSDPILAAAAAFAKSANTSDLAGATPWAIEDRMIEYAKSNARKGESTEAAVARLSEDDGTMRELAHAAYWASSTMQQTLSGPQQLKKFREHVARVGSNLDGGSTFAKRAEIAKALDDVARAEQLEGETFLDAYDRLMKTDEGFSAAYAAYAAYVDGKS